MGLGHSIVRQRSSGTSFAGKERRPGCRGWAPEAGQELVTSYSSWEG